MFSQLCLCFVHLVTALAGASLAFRTPKLSLQKMMTKSSGSHRSHESHSIYSYAHEKCPHNPNPEPVGSTSHREQFSQPVTMWIWDPW